MSDRVGVLLVGVAILLIFISLTVAPKPARELVMTAGVIGILVGMAMVLLE